MSLTVNKEQAWRFMLLKQGLLGDYKHIGKQGALDFIRQEGCIQCPAPLDSLIWDRKLIKALFGFNYTWEIYTPAEKRKYGAYILPILWGERFIGRIEAVNDRKPKSLDPLDAFMFYVGITYNLRTLYKVSLK
jgi:uncharacterized protein YcaQ